ncbi:MAG TPA: tail fiber domain-containing protein [Candidatus Udaeobacter sp.]
MKKPTIIAVFSALACLALLSMAQAAPSPERPAPNATDSPAPGVLNTRDGQSALSFITTGIGNSAFGAFAQFSNTTGSFNTACGAAALDVNSADQNTAVGAAALLLNQIGSDNNAVGVSALLNNDSSGNGSANFNNAFGRNALLSNVDGDENDSFGDDSMEENTTGSQNTAMGDDSLDANTTGNGNVAVGKEAGNSIVDGNDNVVLGHNAGIGIVHASRNVAIGSQEAGPFADFDDTCFIGSIFGEIVSDPGSQTAVFVDQFNVVGIFNSSQKYKHDIQPMDKASETLYQLKPVTFKFNSDWKGTTQYGLIAEDVAKVDPQLVSRKDGDIVTVHYEQINNMLLNEFLKEHKKVQDLETTVAQQQKGMEILTAQLKEQTAQIQKVSAQLQVSKPAPQVVATKP